MDPRLRSGVRRTTSDRRVTFGEVVLRLPAEEVHTIMGAAKKTTKKQVKRAPKKSAKKSTRKMKQQALPGSGDLT